jgi:hypothetical protein
LIDQTANQTLVAGQRYKIAYAYKSGDWALYINGVQKRTNTAAAVPAVSQFNFNGGGYGAAVATVKNEFSQALLFTTRLSNDSDLATLTLIEEIGLDNLCNHTKGGDGTFGYKHKETSKAKMSLADKSYTKTEEYRNNMSKVKTGTTHKGKELIQLSTGFVFDSMHHVADHLGLNRNRILSAFYWYRKGKPKRNIIKDFELL